MANVLNILCSSGIFDANDISLTDMSAPLLITTLAFVIFLLVGIAFLIYWSAATSFGKTALENTPPRRNAMAFYVPLIPFGVWLSLNIVLAGLLGRFELTDLQQNLVSLGCIGVIAIVIIGMTAAIVRKYFVRGFKGFGLDPRTIGRDFIGAIAKLLAVWPLVLGMMLLTICVGRLIYGPDFEIQKHEELEILTKYPFWWVKVVIVVFAVIVAPIYEEILFRGHFQTAVRNLTQRPWVAIVFASGVFAMVHANGEHWPALFVLSIGLGYAYEKSGSLFQSIFMHAIFNGAMVAATLLQG